MQPPTDNLWKDPSVPKEGWTCESVVDLNPDEAPGDSVQYETCQMCGHEQIRFVHTMTHPQYFGALDTGCICAGHMSGDLDGSKESETRLKRKASRRKNWNKRRWRISQRGNEFLNVDNVNITIFPSKSNHQRWRFGVAGDFSVNSYDSVADAKRAAFERFWEMTNDIR